MCIRNTNMYFLVFHALFFYSNTVILYLTKGYIEKRRQVTFASLVTLALVFLKICENPRNLRFHSFGCGSTALC